MLEASRTVHAQTQIFWNKRDFPESTGAPLLMAACQTTLWRWISGILGVTCLSLMAILGTILRTYSCNISCQERWIGYQCNCYFISNESKSWNESRDSCASQKSTLLQMHSGDELHFMKRNPYFYWIGVTYSAAHGALVWLNGSAVSQDLFPRFKIKNPEKCIGYSPSGYVLEKHCWEKFQFICKQQLT
ncbi:natural killer cells antigen CD94-like [Talpa occidentalis]|uniref:natural killer cells antigen CD94-like n=1 Tax=Talpa occidentalis TaxID=50954 RepID=UPI00188FC6A2|nr:natural killer cells antigen CD94-like [Talpa occidentalis]